ncbi:polyprenyl synthetase [Streptomyces sp. NBC_00989]|uniref:polyprenyl synthetase n=1 Tax=Streptomyces sp. NBC_00989 TaxID=2903705 RepID=UPI0038639ED4|nr:polyprenyl synthetase [Streptomyces sp. NBC_00989]
MAPAAERHEGHEGLDERALLLVAGLAELAVSTVGSAVGSVVGSTLGAVRGLLRRSDAAELAADAEHELAARGRLVLDRYTAVPPAHLETLARHALARQAAADGV